ncbi:hypothetical protein [Bacillus sp. FJAT-45037]|nr:hypothetical protein [Bacillus sp. FJAT-45037]
MSNQDEQRDRDWVVSSAIGILGDVVLFVPRLIIAFVKGIT